MKEEWIKGERNKINFSAHGKGIALCHLKAHKSAKPACNIKVTWNFLIFVI